MSVEIDPVELGFHRPFTSEVSQALKIRNPNHTPVAFKVKTTAPKQYCVRPNSGRIEPGKEVEVTVILQAMKQEPPEDAKCRDKFLVQSVPVTADKEFTNIAAIWSHVDSVDKESVSEKKIRVVFLPVGGSSAISTPQKNSNVTSTNGSMNVVQNGDGEIGLQSYLSGSRADMSPSPETFTPQHHPAPVGPVSTFDSRPHDNQHLGDARASATNPATSQSMSVGDSVSSAVASVTSAIPTSYEEVKNLSSSVSASVASTAQEGGLRMRKAVGANTDETASTNMGVKQASSEGVPVQVVAALCLLSFLIAYLFF